MPMIDMLRRLFGDDSGGDGPGRIECHEALRLINEYLDGELEGVSNEVVRAHLEVCEKCYPQLKLERAFREAVRRVSRNEPTPPHLRARVLEALARAGS